MKEKYTALSPFMQVVLLLVIGGVCFLVLSMLIASILHALFGALPSSPMFLAESHPIVFMLLYFVPFQVGFILIPGLLYQFLQPKENNLFMSPKFFRSGLIWSLLLFVSVFLLLPVLTEVNIFITQQLGLFEYLEAQKLLADEQIALLIGAEVSETAFVFGLLVIGVLTGVAEELLFRGFIFHHLLKNTGQVWKSVLISALLFAILHFNFIQLIPLFFFGLALAVIYFVTGRLVICIVLHSANNILNIYWMRSGGMPDWMENTYWWIALPALALLFMLMYIGNPRTWTVKKT